MIDFGNIKLSSFKLFRLFKLVKGAITFPVDFIQIFGHFHESGTCKQDLTLMLDDVSAA